MESISPSQYGWLQKSLSTSTSSNTNIYNTDSGSVIIQCSDGYEGAVNVLEQATAGSSNNPKQENEQQKHMVIFIDPPYKDLVRECSQVEKTVQKLLQLHTGCTIMVWIPNLPSPLDPEEYVPKLIERLKETARQFHNNKNNDDPLHWLHASLQVKCSKDQRKGLLGSSMWVVNPPIGFSSNFLMSLAGLSECLKQNCNHYQLETD